MDKDFWQQRWHQGRIGFHQTRVIPLLPKHWPALELPTDSRVLVPLAGKSLDVAWLADQGHYVLAVELSAIAVEQFFTEQGLTPAIHESAQGRHYTAGRIEFICGDIFDLNAATLAGCAGCYDRAALIALPADMRQRYVTHVYGGLPTGCRGLLLTLDYPQAQMDGPPFALDDAEIHRLYTPGWRIDRLETRSILEKEPHFAERGLTRMDTLVYRLRKE
uniref:thiopurine S-methyltransferase n=1 Tax=Castellaniella defragrans TaxID=75697 RepID=UPI003341FE43